ncbi:MAG: hypothetical protein DMG44_14420 [Acidobacteria bacterium]|nr:MAG: hypothetical protein DMG44_14420 [Acidobacteriota bacterium]
MTTPDERFESELDVFRTEAAQGTQFFYAYVAVRAAATAHEPVLKLLNQSALFWNTNLAALQTSAFIVLGRIFDQTSPHNLDRVLRIARDNPRIFSRVSLGRRRQGNKSEPPPWLAEFLRAAYEPTPKDFRRIRAHVRKWRRVYEKNYRDLRHKVFAHNVVDRDETAALFGRTNIRELQRMFVFLNSLHEALWQSFVNGARLVLRPLRYSVKRMRALPSPGTGRWATQERITHEVTEFLLSASSVANAPLGG